MAGPYTYFLGCFSGSVRALILRWTLLLLTSVVVTLVLDFIRLPAVLMLGPMLAGVIFAVGGSRLCVPPVFFYASQAIIGCLIAASVNATIVGSFLSHWALFLGVVLSTLFVTSAMGWFACRMKMFPGTTAIWGISPGAATAMIVMSASYGGDPRLVAFMQYLRVIFVALCATLVARLFIESPAASPGQTGQAVQSAMFSLGGLDWFPSLDIRAFGLTLLLAVATGVTGKISRLPAGVMLAPMVVGAVLHGAGGMEIVLPQWLLAVSYALLGWSVGLGFTRDILAHAVKLLPRICVFILILIAFGAGLAFLLVYLLDVDPVTAYLATSPGGMDSIAIIAATTDVDVLFVMTLQTLRLLLVVLLGPHLSHFIASRMQE